jgi:hypothetical protein
MNARTRIGDASLDYFWIVTLNAASAVAATRE